MIKSTEPKFNTFGSSVNKIRLSLFEVKETVPKNIVSIFKSLREKVEAKDMEAEEAMDILDGFGDSVEKVLLNACLIDIADKDA